jgi:hypothetical protein
MRRTLLMALLLLFLSGCESEWTNRLPYAGPIEVSVNRGSFLPGTDIQYLGQTDKGAQVSIGGQGAVKKLGDSLDWRGDMLPGVSVDQTLRVAFVTEETLHNVGTVRVIVTNPRTEPGPVNKSAPVHYKLPVGYHVETGNTIPGTTLTYLGQTAEGAQLGNVEGYPYRKIGDSITWQGKLREGLWLELDLRTALITEGQLDVVGTADLWIVPVGERGDDATTS